MCSPRRRQRRLPTSVTSICGATASPMFRCAPRSSVSHLARARVVHSNFMVLSTGRYKNAKRGGPLALREQERYLKLPS